MLNGERTKSASYDLFMASQGYVEQTDTFLEVISAKQLVFMPILDHDCAWESALLSVLAPARFNDSSRQDLARPNDFKGRATGRSSQHDHRRPCQWPQGAVRGPKTTTVDCSRAVASASRADSRRAYQWVGLEFVAVAGPNAGQAGCWARTDRGLDDSSAPCGNIPLVWWRNHWIHRIRHHIYD